MILVYLGLGVTMYEVISDNLLHDSTQLTFKTYKLDFSEVTVQLTMFNRIFKTLTF